VEQRHHLASLPDIRAFLHPLLGLSKKGNGIIHSIPANNNRVQHDSTVFVLARLLCSAGPKKEEQL
jgi:hypothetical protein